MKQNDKNLMKDDLRKLAVAVAFSALLTGVALAMVIHNNQHKYDNIRSVINTDTIPDITDIPEEYHPTLEEIEDAILEDMATAFAIVESGNRCDKPNLPEDAIGCLQIRRIMVDEANNILGEHFFDYEDRWDRNMSFYIFEVVMRKKNRELDIDQACDIWNPNCPMSYRNAVKSAYAEVTAKSLERRGY